MPNEVYLLSVGPSRVLAIKAIRRLTGLGLPECDALVQSAPVLLGTFPEDAYGITDLDCAGCVLFVAPSRPDPLLDSPPLSDPPTSASP